MDLVRLHLPIPPEETLNIMSVKTQQDLTVAFFFVQMPGAIQVHVNRDIAIGENLHNHLKYLIEPELELALAATPGIRLEGVIAVNKFTLNLYYSLAFDESDLCIEIALALARYFDVDDKHVHIGAIVDKREVGSMATCR